MKDEAMPGRNRTPKNDCPGGAGTLNGAVIKPTASKPIGFAPLRENKISTQPSGSTN
jgi:hypothetical protein